MLYLINKTFKSGSNIHHILPFIHTFTPQSSSIEAVYQLRTEFGRAVLGKRDAIFHDFRSKPKSHRMVTTHLSQTWSKSPPQSTLWRSTTV